MDKFKLENLGSGITAVISKEHGFGTDALLLADFAAVRKNNRCCDMGSGCGIIPLLWLKKNMSRPVAAVEISEQGCEQMKKAAEVNSLGGRLEIFNEDLRRVREFLPAGEFDVVTMNPPYKAEGAGIVSADGAAAMARHGLCCSLDDMCTASAWLLKFGGKFCVCLRPERLCELMCKMNAAGIEPKRLRTVSKRDGFAPWLVLVEGRRGGKPGMTVEPQLNIYDGDGYSEYMKSLYSDYERERENNDRERKKTD